MTETNPLNIQLAKALNIRLTGWNPAGNTDDALMAALEAGSLVILAQISANLWRSTVWHADGIKSAEGPTPSEAIAQAVLAAVGGTAFERAADGVGK